MGGLPAEAWYAISPFVSLNVALELDGDECGNDNGKCRDPMAFDLFLMNGLCIHPGERLRFAEHHVKQNESTSSRFGQSASSRRASASLPPAPPCTSRSVRLARRSPRSRGARVFSG